MNPDSSTWLSSGLLRPESAQSWTVQAFSQSVNSHWRSASLVPGPGEADPRDSYDPSPFPLHQCTPEPCGCLFAPTDRCLFAPTLSSDGVSAARQLGSQERLSPNKSKEGRQGTEAGGCLDRQTGGSRDSRLTRSRSWAICHWQERLNGNFNKLLESQWRRA